MCTASAGRKGDGRINWLLSLILPGGRSGGRLGHQPYLGGQRPRESDQVTDLQGRNRDTSAVGFFVVVFLGSVGEGARGSGKEASVTKRIQNYKYKTSTKMNIYLE